MRRRDFLAAGAAALAAQPSAAAIRLANRSWSVEIAPETFAITVTPAGARPIQLSRGFQGHRAGAPVQGAASLSWTWDDRFDIACDLSGSDLSIRVAARGPGKIELIDQPAAAMGQALLLPVAEGYCIRPDDSGWKALLSERHRRLDTAEDLSLPLWGMDHGVHGLHWILTNAFDNSLGFVAEDDGLALGLAHEFSPISAAEPMSMILHLSGGDLLAGAKRYRQHRVSSGSWRPLAEKIAASPEGALLIGASHLYLWDNGLVAAGNIADWPGFVAHLRGGDGLAAALRARFDAEARELLLGLTATPSDYQRKALLRAFNAALTDLARARWQDDEAAPDAIVSAYRTLRDRVIAEFPSIAIPDGAEARGPRSSGAIFDQLHAAGLDRLWIGLGDGWEGGLWNPEAIRAGTARGYLVAPYDSYETAILPGQRPDWATAQLGSRAYRECAIIGADGKPLAGFQATGHFTNAACMAPILRGRVAAIAGAAGFNSWFLDTYATGMAPEDHRPGRPMSSAGNAAAQVAACRWVGETLGLASGSEGGNAVGADGVLFAHGIETPLFGWGDPDLRKNARSPFYFGAWYPPEAPAAFFKPVPLKQPYVALYFDPRTRLPLYQAAFHGSLISTHQWGFDQLKFANVVEDRALLQQLYNHPPLFHISPGTRADRIEAIGRHDAFFRPLHQRLAAETMERFEWLSEDRQVQRTRFSDGTVLVANFAAGERRHDGVRLPGKSVTAIRGKAVERRFLASRSPRRDQGL